MVQLLKIQTRGQGLHEITEEVRRAAQGARGKGLDGGLAPLREGLCTVFIRHTSASLVIQENADPSARRDLEAWMSRHVPEGDPHFRHNDEGPDDMPSHIKAALTSTSISIPIINGQLGLGRWQGIYVWEHRRVGHTREVLVHVGE
jgi:secondary thiamine-phosphate synthase enzyme